MTRRSTSPWLTAGLAGAVLLLAMLWPPIRSRAEQVGWWFLRPVTAVGTAFRSWDPSSNVSKLRIERDQLRQQLALVSTRLNEANQQLALVQVATSLQGFSSASHHQLVLAPVIATSPDPGIQSVVVAKGSDDGVRLGLVAVTNDGQVVGKVVTVRQTTSTILLLTDRQASLAARIQNAAQSLGLVNGERGLALRMEFIPKNDQVRPGQAVVTSGTEAGIPPDLLVATVGQTSVRSGELFQNATLTSTVDFPRLRLLGIVRQ